MILVRMDRVGRARPGPATFDVDPVNGTEMAATIHAWVGGKIASRDYVVAVTSDDDDLVRGEVFIDGGRYGRGTWEVLDDDAAP